VTTPAKAYGHVVGRPFLHVNIYEVETAHRHIARRFFAAVNERGATCHTRHGTTGLNTKLANDFHSLVVVMQFY